MVMKAMFGNAQREKEEKDYKTKHGRTELGTFKEGYRVYMPLDGDHGALPIGTNYEVPGSGTITLYDGKIRLVDSEVFNHELEQYKKRKKQVEDLADAFLESGDAMAIKYLGYYYNWLQAGEPSSNADILHLYKCIQIDGYKDSMAQYIIENDIQPYDGRPSSITIEVQTSEKFIKKLNKLLWIIRYVGIVFTGKDVNPTPSATVASNEKLYNPNRDAHDNAKLEVMAQRGIDNVDLFN